MKEVTKRGGRSCNKLLNNLNEKRGCWKLKDTALDPTLWRTCFGRACGPFVRQTAELMNSFMEHWITFEDLMFSQQCC